jgi:biotin carboxyl carrier protein
MTASRVTLTVGPRRVVVALSGRGPQITAHVGGHEIQLSVERLGPGTFAVSTGGRRRIVYHAAQGDRHLIQVDGRVHTVRLDAGGEAPGARGGHHQDLTAPMPGAVTRIFVEEGQTVRAGDPLFVVEAMKMEHMIRAPLAGRVTRVRASSGAQVEAGAVVVEVDDLALGAAGSDR